MSNLPLPGLMPDDHENLLSTEARQRISTALVESDRIRKGARSAMELRGYWGTPQAFIEMREADMEAARTVIRAEAEEYRKLGLPGLRFREITRMRIESMVYSLEFSNMQRDALEAEFLWLAQPEATAGSETTHESVSSTERTIKSASATALVAAHMKSHAESQGDFAFKAHISEKTLGRLLRNGSASARTWAEVAKAMDTTPKKLLKETGL
jgi:hypothetical protein